jgi:hypothetical protein
MIQIPIQRLLLSKILKTRKFANELVYNRLFKHNQTLFANKILNKNNQLLKQNDETLKEC